MWTLTYRSHKCERCGKLFVSHTALQYHFQGKHLGTSHGESVNKEGLQESSQYHTKIDYEMEPTEIPRSMWRMAFKRESKFVAIETCKSCRMCSKWFGTIHARECHEKQEHHFTASKRAQMSIGFNPESILEYKTAKDLKTFVETKLRPISGSIGSACELEVERLIASIEEEIPLLITYVTKGGSYIKGTDAQDCSDVDVVLFSNAFESLEDCQRKIPELLADLTGRLLKSSWANRLIFQKRTPFALRFYFKCSRNHHSHSFDIMLCYEKLRSAFSAGLKVSFYRKLYLCTDSDKIQLYSMALLKYQVEFVKTSTVSVKDLIRLMKHWFKFSFAKATEENKFRRLPSSYTVELLTIYVWELAGKPIFFSFVQGMRAILKLLVHYQDICIMWHKHYGPNFTIFQKVFLKQTRPFVLDPVNPTFNLCENSNAWDEVAYVASQSLLKPLFKGKQVAIV